jgi:hypothetical protein
MAGTIFIVILVLVVVLGLGYQKFRGIQALTFTHVDITGLSLDEIVAIGTKASRSLSDRLTHRKLAARRINSGAGWDVAIRGSVMAFSVNLLPDSKGYRVGGVATKLRIAYTPLGANLFAMAHAMTNCILRLFGIPRNASQLVALRKRVLRAIANEGAVIQAPPPQYLPPIEPTRTVP